MVDGWYPERKQWIYTGLGERLLYVMFSLM